MEMKIIFEQVLILMIIAFVGFLAAKFKVMTPEGNKSLSKLIIKITLPLLILTTFSNTNIDLGVIHNMPYVAGAAFLSILILYFFARISAKAQKLDKENRALHASSTMFGNIGFLGFPLLDAIFPGGEGLIYASIFQLAHDTILWTVGLMMLNNASKTKSKESWKHILNPATIALIIGLLFFIFKVELPRFIYEPFHGIGQSTIFLSMIYTGAILSQVKVKSVLLNYRSYIICFNKLILCPIIFIFIFKLILSFGIEISQAAIICSILEIATPCMIIVSVLTEELGLNSKQSVENIFISSVLSIFTLPLIYYLSVLLLK